MQTRAGLFLIINMLLVVLLTTAAQAQPDPDVVTKSTDLLLERGVLGLFVFLEGVVIFLLFKDLKQQHEKTLEWAVKATEVLATAMAGAQRSEGNQVRALEQLTKNEAALARNEAVLSRVAERLDNNKGSGGSRVVD